MVKTSRRHRCCRRRSSDHRNRQGALRFCVSRTCARAYTFLLRLMCPLTLLNPAQLSSFLQTRRTPSLWDRTCSSLSLERSQHVRHFHIVKYSLSHITSASPPPPKEEAAPAAEAPKESAEPAVPPPPPPSETAKKPETKEPVKPKEEKPVKKEDKSKPAAAPRVAGSRNETRVHFSILILRLRLILLNTR